MRRGMSLGLILLGAAVLYLAGLKYGLPYVFQPDEPITVRRALRFGSGDLNPHFFYYPSLLMYVYFLLYGIYYLLGHLAGFSLTGSPLPTPLSVIPWSFVSSDAP